MAQEVERRIAFMFGLEPTSLKDMARSRGTKGKQRRNSSEAAYKPSPNPHTASQVNLSRLMEFARAKSGQRGVSRYEKPTILTTGVSSET